MNKNLLISMGVLIAAGASAYAGDRLSYPTTAKVDVTDEYFGTRVADPYRWLEDDKSAETAEWVAAQNTVTRGYLDKIPFREALKNRFKDVYRYERRAPLSKVNGKYYFSKNDGLQNQSVIYVQDRLDSEPRVFFDPNTLSPDGTVHLAARKFSPDGKYFAYVISRSGSDWREIYIRDMATGKDLPDHIVRVKFSSVSWAGDGFYYSSYDLPKDGSELSGKNEYHKVYYHKLGTPQSDDRLEFWSPDEPLLFHQASVYNSGRFIFVYESDGGGNQIYVKDLSKPDSKYVLIVRGMDDDCSIVRADNDFIYLHTTKNAPKGKLMAMPVSDIREGNFRTVIPEGKYVMSGVQCAGDKFIVTYEVDACDQPYVYDKSGLRIYKIDLPEPGVVSISSSIHHNEVYFKFSSFTSPGTFYAFDTQTGQSKVYAQAQVNFDCSNFTTEQVSFNSKDGTVIRAFLVHKKGLKLNGKNPVLLYGYGGFNISINPSFSTAIIPFIENGGIYAAVNLRGGAEYGEEWHKAGTKLNKQNVFDDFIAAAEFLIREKYTSAKRIACRGGSNGGLLVGAVVNQRPDLFGAAVAQVGVMDMLRYHKFTIGWNWAADYGTSADSKEMFEYLYRYSPLHNIKNDGTPYPPMLVTTADHDDRVVPAHSFKYAATLQASDTGNAPKIIRIDSKAGHGGGKPISKVIDESADIYGFIMYNLGMKFKSPNKK